MATKTKTFDYSGEPPPRIGDNLLARLSACAMRQKQAEERLARALQEVEDAKAALREIAETEMPSLMEAADMKTFTTKDGLSIQIKDMIFGSIPEESQEAAFKWLADHRADRLIKREFKIEFGREEEAWARKFEVDLRRRKRQLRVKLKRAVNPKTLSSYVREQLEAGVDFPMKLFGVFRRKVSVVEVAGE